MRIDGNDVFAVVHAVRKALERGSRGEGPTLIEALTYRMGGHSTSDDPNAYRASDALKPWADRDPIQRVRHYMRKVHGWTEERDTEILQEVDRRFRAAVEIAERTPKPALDTLVEDVYAAPPWHLVEQREELLAGPRPNEHHG
jgi:2-oxoisovalerate dehydrogenase E1 component alpha subunit